jgi:hypothetical protein
MVKKNSLIYIILVVIVLLIVGLVIYFNNNNKPTPAVKKDCPKELACSLYQVFNKPVDCLSNTKQSTEAMLKCFMDTSKNIKLNTLLYLNAKGFKGPNALQNYTNLIEKKLKAPVSMTPQQQVKFEQKIIKQIENDFMVWVKNNNIKVEKLAKDMINASGLELKMSSLFEL